MYLLVCDPLCIVGYCRRQTIGDITCTGKDEQEVMFHIMKQAETVIVRIVGFRINLTENSSLF